LADVVVDAVVSELFTLAIPLLAALGLGLNFDHYLRSGVLFAVAAAVPQAVEVDYRTQMKNLSSEGTWPNSLKQNK
jgi:type III secretory pathway component EscU